MLVFFIFFFPSVFNSSISLMNAPPPHAAPFQTKSAYIVFDKIICDISYIFLVLLSFQEKKVKNVKYVKFSNTFLFVPFHSYYQNEIVT